MKISHFLTLCLALTLASSQIIAPGNPKIEEVSTSVNSYVPPIGSLQGGTTLYIKGFNFSPVAANNRITVGPYPCIPEPTKTTQNMISCITSKATDSTKMLKLPVTVSVGTKSATCTLDSCSFSYTLAATPMVEDIIPRSVVAGDNIQILGSHKTSNIGDGTLFQNSDIRQIKIGDVFCTLADVPQMETGFNATTRSPIQCRVSPAQVAGQYTFNYQLSQGSPVKSKRMLQTSLFTNQNYEQRVIPQITSMSSNSGSINGQLINLKGVGFSRSLSSYSCTISGQTCKVKTIISDNEIVVEVPSVAAAPTSYDMLPFDFPAIINQTGGYLATNGVKYAKYNIDSAPKTVSQWVNDVKSNALLVPISTRTITELSSPETDDGSSYLEYVNGYIRIPVPGRYVFRLVCNSQFIMKISTVRNQADIKINSSILLSQAGKTFRDFTPYLPNNQIIITSERNFDKQGYYAFELGHLHRVGKGLFKVEVEMPSLRSVPIANSACQVDNLIVKPTIVDPEVIKIRVFATQGNFTVFSRNQSMLIGFGDSADKFREGLKNLTNIGAFTPTVTMAPLVATGGYQSGSAPIGGYQYNITFDRFRPDFPLPQIDTSKLQRAFIPVAVQVQKISNHSASLSGSFRLFTNGAPIMVGNNANIPFNISEQELTQALRQNNLQEARVWRTKGVNPEDQINLVIEYFGVNSRVSLTTDTSLLRGGRATSTISTTVTSLRDLSTREVFSPLPYQFLFTPSSLPGLQLSVNSIPAVCDFGCSYQYISSRVELNTIVFSGTTRLTFSFTNSSSLTFTIADVSAFIGGFPCTIVSGGTLNSFTCQVPRILPANIYALPAGFHLPVVHVRQLGYASYSAGALTQRLFVPLIATMTPNATSINAGIEATISGRGFPSSSSQGLQIRICQALVTRYTFISNSLIRFIVPRKASLCQQSNSYIRFNGQQQYLVFDYSVTTVPTVTALSITQLSPIAQSTLTITGTNFGVPASLKVFLSQSGVIRYDLEITAANATQITCVVRGGKVGAYDVLVRHSTNGMSSASSTGVLTLRQTIASLTPVSSNKGGGYTITITGTNFPTSYENHRVQIGPLDTHQCLISSMTATQIVCTVPPMPSTYAVGTAYNISIIGRNTQTAICTGTCTFTYVEAGTSTVVVPSTTEYRAGELVVLTGTGLSNASVTINEPISSDLIQINNATYLSFYYPSLPAGNYSVVIRVTNGLVYPVFKTTTPLVINTISTPDVSLKGIQLILTGNGFPNIVELAAELVCSAQVIPVKIASATPTTVVLSIPESTTAKSCMLNFTTFSTFKQFTLSYSSAKTCEFTVTGTAGVGPFTLTSTSSFCTGFIPQRVQLVLQSSLGLPTTSTFAPTNLTTPSGSLISTATFSYLPVGTLKMRIHNKQYGYASITSGQSTAKSFSAAPTTTAVTSSFRGGATLTIIGAGFATSGISNNQVNVCGVPSKVISVTETNITVQVPPLVTSQTNTDYTLATASEVTGKPFADNAALASNIADNSPFTIYKSSAATCFVGFDFGATSKIMLSEIRFIPNNKWTVEASRKLEGAKFEGSDDGSAYTQIVQLDTSAVNSGWNILKISSYTSRYVRFSHTNTSGCQIGQIKLIGIVISTQTVAANSNKTCSIAIPIDNKTISNIVTYATTSTAITVTGVVPNVGPLTGNTSITITGTGFVSPVTVTIDGVACASPTVLSTNSVTCTTAAATVVQQNSFVVTSNGFAARIVGRPFRYVRRWSQAATWNSMPPRDGDSIFIPKGTTLLVDRSTPILGNVTVQGKLQFEDGVTDLTFDAQNIIINGGQFEAGTSATRFNSKKLTITLHAQDVDPQLPVYGNRVIGCNNCIFSMYGSQKTSSLKIGATINPLDTSFTVASLVNWVTGDKVVVSSTSFDHTENQEVQVVSVSGYTVYVKYPFKFRHYGSDETFGSITLYQKAYATLISRNIVIRGNDQSVNNEYGAHLMFTGSQSKGLNVKINNVELTRCGQTRFSARNCINFFRVGDLSNSGITLNSIHRAYARAIALYQTSFLTLTYNSVYQVKGNNIHLDSGSEVFNVIANNIIMSSLLNNRLSQSDSFVSSFYISNPSNTLSGNFAFGGDFNGFNYQLKSQADYPLGVNGICPSGMKVTTSFANTATSHRKSGFRISRLAARKYPCSNTINEADLDPFAANPAVLSTFNLFTLSRNQETGFLGQVLGYVTLNNFVLADNKKSGLQFHRTNLTKHPDNPVKPVLVSNCLIVGYSANSPVNVATQYSGARGVILSRTDGLLLTTVAFYNFKSTMTPIQSCSECSNPLVWVTGGKTTSFSGISYTAVEGNYVFWENFRRQIFEDLDGTLANPLRSLITPAIASQPKATISPYRPSLMIPDKCYRVTTNQKWSNSIYCDSTVRIRSITFTNPASQNSIINTAPIKVVLLNSSNQSLADKVAADYSEQVMVNVRSRDLNNSWALPFASGFYYNVHWGRGIDFTRISIAPSTLWASNEGVVLRFNYTDRRELYQVSKYYQQARFPLLTDTAAMISPDTCNNGDYFHDKTNKYLYVCVSGRNKQIREWVDINGIRCVNFCPPVIPAADKEGLERFWSNATQWPGGVLPVDGANVVIPATWNLILDVDTPLLNSTIVDGNLIFDRSKDLTLTSNYIWARKGTITIGSRDMPYTKTANIVLTGQQSDAPLKIDTTASGNKMLVVTGGIQFYGVQPQTVWTRLTSTAAAGATRINVVSAAGWKVGDSLAIAPSYSAKNQFEQVVITGISNNAVTFTPALQFQHFGSPSVTLQNNYGTLDTRASVGLLSRNIKIRTPTGDTSNWGCRVLVYNNNQQTQAAYAKMRGVEINGCGQYNTSNAALRIQNIGRTAIANQLSTQIEGSSIYNCLGNCSFIKQVANLHINNNVFFNGIKYLTNVEQIIRNYNFTNNLLIGVKKRTDLDVGTVEDVAAYQQYIPIDVDNNKIAVNVSFNLVQGSEGQGFVFPTTSCERVSVYPFTNNTAGSCEIAFMYAKLDNRNCLAASGAIGYASQFGLLSNIQGGLSTLIYDRMFFADNGVGMSLRFAHEGENNSLILNNTYISGISRRNVATLYAANKLSFCNGATAIRMLAVTKKGQGFPLTKAAKDHDSISSPHAFDAKAFISNTMFENFVRSDTILPYCANMFVFRRNAAAYDATASHYLRNTTCIGCSNSLVLFEDASNQWVGCGNISCSGPSSYLIHDQDSSFFGFNAQILSNNSVIGSNEAGCTFNSIYNGYYCDGGLFGVLEFESVAADFNSRVTWPAYLSYQDGTWNLTINAWREWQWNGTTPLNKRMNRFWSLVKLQKNYTLAYSANPPAQTRFQIQKRTLPDGNQSDWMIIRIKYQVPTSVQILVQNKKDKNVRIKPNPIRDSQVINLNTQTTVCGANNFYPDKGIIQFVVTGADCIVRVKSGSFLKGNMRFNLPVTDFHARNGTQQLISSISQMLKVNSSRVQILSIKEGSTIVDYSIQSSSSDQLSQMQNSLNNVIAGSSIAGFPVLSSSVSNVVLNSDGSVFSSSSSESSAQMSNQIPMLTILLVAIIVPLGVIISIIIVVYMFILKKKESKAEVEDIAENNKEQCRVEKIETIQAEHNETNLRFKPSGNITVVDVSKQ